MTKLFAAVTRERSSRFFVGVIAVAGTKMEARRRARATRLMYSHRMYVKVVPVSTVPYLPGFNHDTMSNFYRQEMGSEPDEPSDFHLDQFLTGMVQPYNPQGPLWPKTSP